MQDRKAVRKVVLALLVLGVMLFLVACPPHKSIADIQRDPMRYSSKEVGVAGTVTESFGALGTGIFQIDDGTGKLWVLSSSYGVPAKGTRVAVAGTISPTVSFGGRSFATVMRETRRRR